MTDPRGSVIAIADDTGAVTNINKYDEYGAPDDGNVGRFQYTGQMWLAEAGIYYYKARTYDPEIGRFMQADPIGYGDGMNIYAYVGNDPINGSDPSGTVDEIVVYGHRSKQTTGHDGFTLGFNVSVGSFGGGWGGGGGGAGRNWRTCQTTASVPETVCRTGTSGGQLPSGNAAAFTFGLTNGIFSLLAETGGSRSAQRQKCTWIQNTAGTIAHAAEALSLSLNYLSDALYVAGLLSEGGTWAGAAAVDALSVLADIFSYGADAIAGNDIKGRLGGSLLRLIPGIGLVRAVARASESDVAIAQIIADGMAPEVERRCEYR